MKRREFLTAASVAGGAGAASVPAVAQEGTETPTGTPTGEGEDGADGGGGGGNTWTVEMTDENVFDPETIEVRPGDTIVWENVGSTPHSVTAYQDGIPDDAEYWASGGAGSEDEARDAYPDEGEVSDGGTFEHTFEVEGTHEYFCIPHEQLEMVGSVEVTPDAPTPAPEGAGGGGGRVTDPHEYGVPFQAHFIGIAAGLMVIVSLVYTFFVLKYGESPNVSGGND